MGVTTKSAGTQTTQENKGGVTTNSLGVMGVITKTVITQTTQGKNGGSTNSLGVMGACSKSFSCRTDPKNTFRNEHAL